MTLVRSKAMEEGHGIYRQDHGCGSRHQDVYEVWAAFENYHEFMETIQTVSLIEEDRLHWVAMLE